MHSITCTTSNYRTSSTGLTPWHIRRSDILCNGARPFPKMHNERSRRPNLTGQQIFHEGCLVRSDKTETYQNQMFITRTFKSTTAKLLRSNERRTRWSGRKLSATPTTWTDTFGKAAHWLKRERRSAGEAAHRVSLRLATAGLEEASFCVARLHSFTAHIKHFPQVMSPSTNTNSMNRRNLRMRSDHATPIPMEVNKFTSSTFFSSSRSVLPHRGHYESDDNACRICWQKGTLCRCIVSTRRIWKHDVENGISGM